MKDGTDGQGARRNSPVWPNAVGSRWPSVSPQGSGEVQRASGSGCFLHPCDQLLKRGSWPLLVLSEIDRSLPQAGKVGLGEVLRRVGRQDLQRQVFGESPDQV